MITERALVIATLTAACGSSHRDAGDAAPSIDSAVADAPDDLAGPTSLMYQGLSGESSGTCSSPYSIIIRYPTGAGRFPLYVHIVGTNESYDDQLTQSLLAYMAGHGFVAASLDYPHRTDSGCQALRNKIACMFDPASATTAVHALCGLAMVDCAKGIATSGISQGSQIAVMAGDYDADVKATYAMSTGDVLTAGVEIDMTACMDAPPLGSRTTPNGQIRAVDGELDQFFGKSGGVQSPDTVRAALEHVTGTSCGDTAFSCTNPNGSGWYEVQQSEMVDPTIPADHFYMRDPGYASTFPWSAGPNLDWLVSTIGPH